MLKIKTLKMNSRYVVTIKKKKINSIVHRKTLLLYTTYFTKTLK